MGLADARDAPAPFGRGGRKGRAHHHHFGPLWRLDPTGADRGRRAAEPLRSGGDGPGEWGAQRLP